MNWGNITIEKMQRIAQIEEGNEVLRTAQIISIIKDIPFADVLSMSMDEFRGVDISFLNDPLKSKLRLKFKHNGRRFCLVKDPTKMSAHHFIELQELSKKDVIDVLPEIISCLSYRVNIFGRRIDDDYQWKVDNFKTLPITNFYSYALFFSAVYPKLLNATLTYLTQKKKEVEEMYLDGLA
jgi:hypothetical protein